jgi:hypothetical protein
MARLAGAVASGLLDGRVSESLEAYDGARIRSRFHARLFLRRALEALPSNPLLELGAALLRLPPGRRLAHHVFFGRGSFPDLPLPGDAGCGR